MRVTQFVLSLLLLLLSVKLGNAQYYGLANDIPVMANGSPLKAAWCGGLNAPQFNEVDLDLDGVMDLVVFDRVGGILLPFLNGGTAGQVDYHFAPEYRSAFPAAISDWMLMRDFDGDGKQDIFTAVPQVSNVRVFRNVSSGSLAFSLYQDTIYSNYPPRLPLYSSKSDFPAIDDIDGDGDLDFLTFHIGGSVVEWHKNLSVEQTGGLMGMDFAIQSRCYGHFEEDPFNCIANLNQVPCGPGQRMDASDFLETNRPPHSGSTLLSLELDNFGGKDLIVGDVGCPTVYALFNSVNNSIAHFASEMDSFPIYDQSVFVLNFPASFNLDLNNDGLKDLVVAPNATSVIEDELGVQFYQNVTSNLAPLFRFSQHAFMQDQMIDNGSGSAPCAWDYDQDGLPDLLVAGAGRYDSLAGLAPKFELYRNTGTGFDRVSEDYLDLRNNPFFDGLTWLHATAGDLDGDGDEDLLLGEGLGQLIYWENTAAPGAVASFGNPQLNYLGIDVGQVSAPFLFDLNNDNDLDLLIGNERGYISYYENVGSPANAIFNMVTDTFGGVKINDFTGQSFTNGYAQPFVMEENGGLTLLVGNIKSQIHRFPNISLSPGAVFTEDPTPFFANPLGAYSSIIAMDLDTLPPTYILGNYRGGLVSYRAIYTTINTEPLNAGLDLELFPNPAIAQFSWKLVSTSANRVQWKLYDITGNLLREGSGLEKEGTLDIEGIPAGIYLFDIRQGQQHTVRRIAIMD